MAEHTCKHCGGSVEWRDNMNHYREFCEDCAEEIAAERIGGRHKDICEDPECLICTTGY